MQKKTRDQIIVYLTLAAAALPFLSEFAQNREEKALKVVADGMIYGVVRKSGDPMANHQADLLERIERTQAKQKFIYENRSNLGLYLSFLSAACAVGLGYFGLKEVKKL